MAKREKANIKTTRSINNPESPKRDRGRPREFDREQALKKAMRLFWSRGYDAVSMADLRAELGITQASLYAAFVSKEQLFHDAVELYRQTVGFSTTAALATGHSAREAIHAMLQAAVDAYSAPDSPGGCLLILGATNCPVESKTAGSPLSDTPPDNAIHPRSPEKEATRWRHPNNSIPYSPDSVLLDRPSRPRPAITRWRFAKDAHAGSRDCHGELATDG